MYESIRITKVEVICGHVIVSYEFDSKEKTLLAISEPYQLCNKHLRTWRAYNSTEDSQRARITNNKDK